MVISNAKIAAINIRIEFVVASAFLLSTLSTMAPIGMANSNQGSIAKAPIMEIKSGSRVKVIANNGKAVFPKPSAKLVNIFAVQSRLNASSVDIR